MVAQPNLRLSRTRANHRRFSSETQSPLSQSMFGIGGATVATLARLRCSFLLDLIFADFSNQPIRTFVAAFMRRRIVGARQSSQFRSVSALTVQPNFLLNNRTDKMIQTITPVCLYSSRSVLSISPFRIALLRHVTPNFTIPI